MFGMSREERRRLEDLERVAREGRDKGDKATLDLASHTAVCTERHNTINATLGELKGSLRWANRQGVILLVMTLGAILLGIAEHKGLF